MIRFGAVLCCTALAASAGVAPGSRLDSSLARSPLAFERNVGQAGSAVRFLVRGAGYAIFFGAAPEVTVLAGRPGSKTAALRMGFAGAGVAEPVPEQPLAGTSNYFSGSRRAAWKTGVRHFGRLRYRGVYPGIDVVFYGNRGRLEYDLEVKPGADPGRIELRLSGGAAPRVDAAGALVLGDGLRLEPPSVYQVSGGGRVPVAARYVAGGAGRVRFALESYDRSAPLVIDPVLTFSAAFGGSNSEFTAAFDGVATDASGYIYVTGLTFSTDIPAVNAIKTTASSLPDAFLAKLTPDGSSIVYSTYLGGSGSDEGRAVTVDPAGSAVVTGVTTSSNFPTLNPVQAGNGGAGDTFITRFTPAGNALVFSTYVGSNGSDYPFGIALDPAGNTYVAGVSGSGAFPTTPGALQRANNGNGDAYIVKLNSSGGFVFSTLLGSTDLDQAYAVAPDAAGNAYVTGVTSGTFPTTPGAYRSVRAGASDAFVAKIKADGSALLYSTLLGGTENDAGYSIAVEAALSVWIGGETSSANFPATTGALQSSLRGTTDGFLARLDANGQNLLHSSYLGGSGTDAVYRLVQEAAGNIVAGGTTSSTDFPTAAPLQGAKIGSGAALSSSTDGGGAWSPVTLNAAAVQIIKTVPSSPSVVYASDGATVFQSSNSGATFTAKGSPGSKIWDVAPHPTTSTSLWAGTSSGVRFSSNAGATWTLASNGIPSPTSKLIRVLAVAPSDGNTLYAASGAVLYRSTDGAANWTTLTVPWRSSDAIDGLAVSPADPARVFAGTGGGLYLSTNGGLTWTGLPAAGCCSFSTLTYAPSDPSVMYFAGGRSLYRGITGGEIWSSAPIPVDVVSLAVDPANSSVVYLGTSGNGIYKTSDGVSWSAANGGTPLGQDIVTALRFAGSSSQLRLLAGIVLGTDIFAARFNATGTSLVQSTYLGGTGPDSFGGLDVDPAGGIVVLSGSGSGVSPDFPVTPSALQAATRFGPDVFVSRIDSGDGGCDIQFSPTSATVASGPGILRIRIVTGSGCAWSATSAAAWLTVPTQFSGTGLGMLDLAYTGNFASASRTATVSVNGRSLTVTQLGPSPACSVAPPPPDVLTSRPASTSFQLNMSGACTNISVGGLTSWLALGSIVSLPGSAALRYTVLANDSQSARTATLIINVSGVSVTKLVHQAGSGCTTSLNTATASAPAAGGDISVVLASSPTGCAAWRASSEVSWAQVASATAGTGSANVQFRVSANNSPTPRTGTLNVGGHTVTLMQAGAGASNNARFVPVTPCRIADTRNPGGPFGGPTPAGGSSRDFAIPQSACGIPQGALAYSLNVTVAPQGPLGYLTIWPTGQPQPFVSTLNSFDGSVVANAAIVPAGANGAVSVFVTNTTDVIIDVNGYFANPTTPDSLPLFTVQPCRILDTRGPAGALGAPSMAGGASRDFPVPSSSCNLPATARAYSLNATVVPPGPLGYLTVWPTGRAQPFVSTLNSFQGKVVANAALVPAGTNGAVSAFVTNPTDLILDANGYFAPTGAGTALSFYPVSPCRVVDTRSGQGPIQGGVTRDIAVPASSCSVPSSARAYSLNVTAVPAGPLAYLTIWPTGSAQPVVSTLNSFDGRVVANAAIVPAGTNGAVAVFASNPTDVILDINGYFAP